MNHIQNIKSKLLLNSSMLSGQKYAEDISLFNSNVEMPIFAGRLENGDAVHVNVEFWFIQKDKKEVEINNFEVKSITIEDEEVNAILSIDLIKELQEVAKSDLEDSYELEKYNEI